MVARLNSCVPEIPHVFDFWRPRLRQGRRGSIISQIPPVSLLSCGDAFQALEARSPLGQKFVEYSSKGQLVPDEFTIELWENRSKHGSPAKPSSRTLTSFGSTGFRANPHQAKLLEPFCDVLKVFTSPVRIAMNWPGGFASVPSNKTAGMMPTRPSSGSASKFTTTNPSRSSNITGIAASTSMRPNRP